MSGPENASGAGAALSLDLCGYRCPIPVIRMEAALRRMAPGESLTVAADDPLAALDIPHFARAAGHRAMRLPSGEGAKEGVCVFLVTRGEKPPA